METPTIEITDLHKEFSTRAGKVRAVNGINLNIAPGQRFALLGSNGAGKSTTLEILLGLQKPSSGTVSIGGLAPRLAMGRGLIGAGLQSGGFLPDLSVRETLRVLTACFNAQSRLPHIIESTNIGPLMGRRMGTCSGGEIQRVRLAVAMLPGAPLLVLDEPTAGMDPHARREFWQLITASPLPKAQQQTLIFATHDMTEAERFADTVAIMHAGLILAEGPVAQIKAEAGAETLDEAFFYFTDLAAASIKE